MLVCVSFRAKNGKEREFEELLNNPEGGRMFARALGASRNTLFLAGGRMVRVFEFPDDAKRVPMAQAAQADPRIADFLRCIGPLIEDGFDYDRPETLDAFNKRATLPLVYDVQA